ncbi:MAG: pyrroline-5-carboxylate reductase [Lachnospiraceae bacterium]|nr:pyrroline-5-carboxylate reductase [Lachnospiraceae bacterium]
MRNIGFVGMGNMAYALVEGFVGSKAADPAMIRAYAPHQEKLQKNCQNLGITAVDDVKNLVQQSDMIFIACKPYQIESALKEVLDIIKGKAVISIASGWGFEKFKRLLGDSVRVQFVMPNTPAMVGEGVFLFEETNSLTEEERNELISLFSSIGIVEELPAKLMDIGSAVSGCGPAFVDVMAEAYADAAVKYGIPRDTAYRLVSKMIMGSAKLIYDTGKHPAQLKDAVCSPAGTTIRGVEALEKNGFRSACMASVEAIMDYKRS